MNAKEFATQINLREYPFGLTKEEKEIAKQNNLMICFGESDDNLEFLGFYDEEVGAYDGTIRKFRLDKRRIVESDDCKDCLLRTKQITINAIWNPTELKCSWLIKTDAKDFETFDIMEEGELFCRGIVINMTKEYE